MNSQDALLVALIFCFPNGSISYVLSSSYDNSYNFRVTHRPTALQMHLLLFILNENQFKIFMDAFGCFFLAKLATISTALKTMWS